MRNYKYSALRYDELHAETLERFAVAAVGYLYPNGVPDRTMALDLGCGTGTFLGELQRKGISGVGVDLCPEMIYLAREKYPLMDFYAADMVNFKVDRYFDLVACTNDAINYLVPNQREAFFANVNRHLNEGGRFYVDFDTETDFVKHWDGQSSQAAGEGWQLIRSHIYDPKRRVGTEIQKWIIETESGVIEYIERHDLHPLAPDEVRRLAKGAGLQVNDFIEPVAMCRVEKDLHSYLRLGCVIRKGDI